MDEAIARAWANLIGRLDGPLYLRFLVQPAVATALAARAGIHDARAGMPPFLWSIFTGQTPHPGERLRHGWRDISLPLLVALALDAIYQAIVHNSLTKASHNGPAVMEHL
jgi:hypothetical protein